MTDNENLIHEFALAYAQAKLTAELIKQSFSDPSKLQGVEPDDIKMLVDGYNEAVPFMRGRIRTD